MAGLFHLNLDNYVSILGLRHLLIQIEYWNT